MGCGASSANAVGFNLKGDGPIESSWMQVCETLDVPKGSKRKNKLVLKRTGWKTIRVFVSSTFKDLHHERETLVKEVFPDLRVWCEQRRLHLVDVDLRWGIPKDTSSESTLRICLGEIDRCYQDNGMPFFLNMTSERVGWIPLEEEVSKSLVEQYRWVFGLSVTEMEIVHGAYRKDNPNSLFMIRDDSFLQTVPPNLRKTFLDESDLAPDKLKILKTMISDRFPAERIVKYKCSYAGLNERKKARLEVDQIFKEKVFEFFKARIEEQYPLPDSNIDQYQQAKEAHEAFLRNRSDGVFGRDYTLEQMKEYVDTGGDNIPLVIIGEPGTGKSSLMAKASDIADSMGQQSGKWHVFYHFVGAVPGSTDLEILLQRLLKELKVVNDGTMPKDLATASQLTLSVLSNPQTKPVIIFVDAMNQLDEDDEALNCSWIPKKLSPSVRCIFSMIATTHPHKSLMARTPKPRELLVEPLTLADRWKITNSVLGNFNKKLDEDQMLVLLSNKSSENPLWLSIALEELRVYGEFATLSEKVKSLAPGLLELLGQVLERFEVEAGGDLVVATLCLIEVSARGLLEAELLQILADVENLMPPKNGEEKDSNEKSEKDEKMAVKHARLPAIKWSAIFRALRTFLRPYGDSGDGRLDFYHRSLSKAVRRKYFGEGSNQNDDEARRRFLWWHKKLATFFQSNDNIERKVEELPFHLIKLDEKEKLADCLTDMRVFDELFHEEFSSKLIKYWNVAAGKDVMQVIRVKYMEVVANLENSDADSNQLAFRFTRIANFLIQAGVLNEACELAEKAMKLEETELGNRPEKMAKILDVLFKMYDEKTKLNEFIYMSQKPLQWKVISTGQKCVEMRKTLSGETNKRLLAMMLTKVAFSMNTWIMMSGGPELTKSEAQRFSMEYINSAIDTFKEMNDLGHLAEAIMTKAVLTDSRSQNQRMLYEEAYEMCKQVYGEYSVLSARCQINTGIHFEEAGDYVTSYKYFKRYAEVTEEVFGPDHPKAERGKNILQEPMYKRIHQEQTENNNE